MLYSLSIALGGALGALSRYWAMHYIALLLPTRLPWGTFAVNALGSLLIGIFYVLVAEKVSVPEQWRAIILVGYLGAFTTFSTFSLDALLLILDGHYIQAFGYVLASVVICILAAGMGISLMRAFY
ncbi:MAG: fluoride efflux transporter CrcB [Pseudohongiellaceae bacterium]|nr:fluoride efflux transporter CrcB [Pseudohongiellaceae bacterium]